MKIRRWIRPSLSLSALVVLNCRGLCDQERRAPTGFFKEKMFDGIVLRVRVQATTTKWRQEMRLKGNTVAFGTGEDAKRI
jgi:hypothetical protein